MSEIKENHAKIWGPPAFPKEGRLPGTLRAVGENYGRQTFEADKFKRERDEHGRRQHGKCCQAVHISLFFDGTNNNEKNDTQKGHPTNIARLRPASLLCLSQGFYESRQVFIKGLIKKQEG